MSEKAREKVKYERKKIEREKGERKCAWRRQSRKRPVLIEAQMAKGKR